MVGWHHWLNEHEFQKTPEDGEGQGSLVCCSPWGHQKSDMTESLNNNKHFTVCFMASIQNREATCFSSVQFSSVAQSCPTLCDPMNRSTPGLPVHHQPLEFIQTYAHRVSDAIQPSHPLLSPSPAPNPSKNQGLFQWVNSLHEVAKVLEFQLQHQSFQWTPRAYMLSHVQLFTTLGTGPSQAPLFMGFSKQEY